MSPVPTFASVVRHSLAFQPTPIPQSMAADPASMIQYRAMALSVKLEDAKARLAKYTPSLDMDPSKAAVAMREMAAWNNDYGAQVSSLPDPNAPMPLGVRPSLPSDQARSWIAAIFFDAEYGIHFYKNGTVSNKVRSGEMDASMANADLDARERALQLLTAMDEDGTFKRVYSPGLGALTLPGALVIIAIIALAGVYLVHYLSQSEARSQVWVHFDKMCEEAKAAKDKDPDAKAAYQKCIEAVKPPAPAKDPIETAVYVLGGVLGVYVIGYFVAPKLIAYARSGRV